MSGPGLMPPNFAPSLHHYLKTASTAAHYFASTTEATYNLGRRIILPHTASHSSSLEHPNWVRIHRYLGKLSPSITRHTQALSPPHPHIQSASASTSCPFCFLHHTAFVLPYQVGIPALNVLFLGTTLCPDQQWGVFSETQATSAALYIPLT